MIERGKRPNRGSFRPVVFLASAVLHAVVLALLVRYSTQTVLVYEEAPTLRVTLVPPLRSGPARRDRVDLPPDDHDALARTAPAPPDQPVAPSPTSAATASLTPSGEAPGEGELAAKGRQALRGLPGCDQPQLTREEREQCEVQRWARAAPVTVGLNLDLSGRYAKNPEPFLSRRPKKGCRVRVAGDVDGLGNDMNARAGVTCVKAF